MLVSLRRDAANLSLPAIQLVLIATGFRIGRGAGVLVVLALLLLTSLIGWWRGTRHSRIILDTPTSRVASAAQGYTELRGIGRPLDGTPLLSPANGLPVLWYHVETQRKDAGGKWVHESTVTSDASFSLDDGSGVVAVDPEGAEMLVRRQDRFDNGDRRIIQRCLIDHDPIYVIGDFQTIGSLAPDMDTAAQVRELLSHWKSDRQSLSQRFDLDGNGEIDLREWELARAQARREVRQRQQEIQSAPEAHLIRCPADGRLFLISDLDPERLARRYRWWSWFHLGLFIATAGISAWLHQIGAF